MFEKITLKQKNLLLIFGMLIFTFIGIKRIYSPLFSNINILKTNNEKITKINDSEQKLSMLQYKSEQLNKQLGEFISNDITEQEILNILAKHITISIAEMNEVHLSKTTIFTTYTHQLLLEGTYNNLAKLVHELESSLKHSKIKHLKYSLKKNFNKKNQLFVLITFQNYEKNNL